MSDKVSMNRQEFADYIGVSLSKLEGMLRRREVSCVRLGGRVIFTEKHAEELFAKNEQKAVERKTRIVGSDGSKL